MNKFTLRSIGALILSFLLIFSVACTSGDKKEKSTATEGKTVELTISAAASLQDALKEIETKYKEKNLILNFLLTSALLVHFNNKSNKVHLLIYSSQQPKINSKLLLKKDSLMKRKGKSSWK